MDVDLRGDGVALRRLKQECERAKMRLTDGGETTTIHVKKLVGDLDFTLNVTVSQFETMSQPLLDCIAEAIDTLMREKAPPSIHSIVLSGGSCNMPMITKIVNKTMTKYGNYPFIQSDMNPSHRIAHGACKMCQTIYMKSKNLPEPPSNLDINPVSIGIEILSSLMANVIDRNEFIPTTRKVRISTCHDHQTSLSLHILAGERVLSKDNISLSKIDVLGLEDKLRGEVVLEIEMELSVDGSLRVCVYNDETKQLMHESVLLHVQVSQSTVMEMVRKSQVGKEVDEMAVKMIRSIGAADEKGVDLV